VNHKGVFKVPRAHQCLVVLSHVSVHFTLTWGLLFLQGLSPRNWFLVGVLFIDEPVMSHDETGAADHSSVDWNVLFDPTQSNSGLSPAYYIL